MENNNQVMLFPQSGISKKNEFQSVSFDRGQLLADKIELAMKKKQYNRQQFAHIMGVQPSIITRWLSGNHNFTVETLFDIEDRLGVQLIAIQRPAYKEVTYHMVVGSEKTQLLNDSSLFDDLSNMSSHIKNNLEIRATCISYAGNINYIEFFKSQHK